MDLVWFTILGVFAGICAVVLVVWGRRGRRVDRHPICRKCGYDLFGLAQRVDDLPEACPECGSVLSSRRRVRIGNRSPRVLFIRIGLLLVLIAAGGLGVVGYWGYQRYEKLANRPDWMLAFQVEFSSDANAIGELYKRGELGRLSEGIHERLLPEALDVQADLQAPWDPAWGDFIEQAIDLQKSTYEQEQRYFAQAFEGGPALILPASIKAGDEIPFIVEYGELRIGRQYNKFMELGNTLLYVGEAEAYAYMKQSGGGGLGYMASGTMRLPGTRYSASAKMPWIAEMGIETPGEYEIKVQAFATLELRDGPFATPFDRLTWEVSTTMEVVPADPPGTD